VVSVYIIYVWNSVSLYRLHLEWCQFISYMFYLCQFISSTCWGGVSLYQFILSTLGLVSVCSIYVFIGVCLYHLRLDWCQFILSTRTLMSVCIIYVWIGVSLYRLHLDWCQFVASTFGLVSVCIVYVFIGVCLYHLRLDCCQFILSTCTLMSV
jgi:hypothetical protein